MMIYSVEELPPPPTSVGSSSWQPRRHLVTVLTNQPWVKTEPITKGRSQIYNDAAVNTGVQKFLNIAILPLEMCIFWSPVQKESR